MFHKIYKGNNIYRECSLRDTRRKQNMKANLKQIEANGLGRLNVTLEAQIHPRLVFELYDKVENGELCLETTKGDDVKVRIVKVVNVNKGESIVTLTGDLSQSDLLRLCRPHSERYGYNTVIVDYDRKYYSMGNGDY